MDTAIGILTILFGVAAATIPSYYRVRVPNGSRKITKAGQFVALLITALVLLQVYQIWRAADEKAIASRNLEIRDSIYKDFIDKNTRSIIQPFAQELKQTNREYDIATKTIRDLVRDSSKQITVSSSVIPEVAINEMFADTVAGKMTVHYFATQAAVYDFKPKAYVILRLQDDVLEYAGLYHNLKVKKMTAGTGVEMVGDLRFKFGLIKNFYIWSKSTYKDQLGRKYGFEEMKNYEVKNERMRDLTDREYVWIFDAFKKNVGQ